MGVRLDDGRQVAFDVKDYAAVDHGYAATIHKAQGVTVDRTHVLATSGMDRHAAYVALSRHRDGVQLHYGRDDFASDAKLAEVLARDRAKDMAADYLAEPDAAVRAFADRREIRLPERVREIVRTVEIRAKSMFAGFRPKAREAERHDAVPESTSRPDRDVAIRRYARATLDAAEMQRKGLPVLPHQLTAMDRAAEALDRIRDHGTEDLVSAFQRDGTLIHDAAAGDTRGVVRAMAEEARVRADPTLRAHRFLERWRELEMGGSGERSAAQAEMIYDLRHDPAMRDELERHAPELGLDRDRLLAAEQMRQRQIEMQRVRERDQDRGFSR